MGENSKIECPMTIDEAITLCHHDSDEPIEIWREAAFVATAEVVRLRDAIEFVRHIWQIKK